MNSPDMKLSSFVSLFVGSIAGATLSLAADRILGPEIPRGFFVVLGLLSILLLLVSLLATLSSGQSGQWLLAIVLALVGFWLFFGLVRYQPSQPLISFDQSSDPSIKIIEATVVVVITPIVVTATPVPAMKPNALPSGATETTLTPVTEVYSEEDLTQRIVLTASSHSTGSNDTCDPQNRTSFLPSNMIDGRSDTAWRVNGDGSNEYFTGDFGIYVTLTRIQILPGYAKVDPCDSTLDWCPRNRKPRTVMLQFSDGQPLEYRLQDSCTWQDLSIPNIETRNIRFTIVDSYPWEIPHHSQFTAVSEIKLFGVSR